MAKSSVSEVHTTQGLDFIRELGQQLRVDSIRASTAAGSGHPTSSMSAADLMAVLITRYFHYDWNDRTQPNNDHLIFSKGHASPLLYSIFKAVGVVSDDELLTFRKFGSRLEGHPTPILPWVDVATGSLGQGLPIAVGVALAGRKLDQLPYHVWTLTGDSELAEGSIWEGLDKAGYYGLSNFTAIFDINRLGQRGPTEYEWETDVYRDRVQAFGCRAIVIDGHDLEQIDQALGQAREATAKPTVVIARTIKGKGFSEIENKDNWHGSPVNRRSRTPGLRSQSQPIRKATRLRPARRTGMRSRRWGPVRGSSPWTGRSATRRSPRSSPERTRTATSRSSSPSSNWSRPPSG